jgi:hypothetical protein
MYRAAHGRTIVGSYNIHIEGAVKKANIAQGPGATAGATENPVSRLLDEFIARVAGYGDEDPRLLQMLDLAESAKTEATTGSPDKGRIRSLLARIRTLIQATGPAAVGAAELADIIDKIWNAVGHL